MRKFLVGAALAAASMGTWATSFNFYLYSSASNSIVGSGVTFDGNYNSSLPYLGDWRAAVTYNNALLPGFLMRMTNASPALGPNGQQVGWLSGIGGESADQLGSNSYYETFGTSGYSSSSPVTTWTFYGYSTAPNGQNLVTVRDSGQVLFSLATAPIPEPSTWALLIAGLAAIGFSVARRGTGMARPTSAATSTAHTCSAG